MTGIELEIGSFFVIFGDISGMSLEDVIAVANAVCGSEAFKCRGVSENISFCIR